MATTPRKRKAPIKQTERVLKEYRCLAHGDFEAYKEICPHGCDTVERVFRTAFSINGTAKNIDKTLDTLAADYGMTDMRNDMGSVMDSMRNGTTDYNPKWGAMPQVKIGEAGNAIAPVLGATPATNMVGDLREGGILEAPRAVPLSPKHVDMTPLNSVRGVE